VFCDRQRFSAYVRMVLYWEREGERGRERGDREISALDIVGD